MKRTKHCNVIQAVADLEVRGGGHRGHDPPQIFFNLLAILEFLWNAGFVYTLDVEFFIT